jgi:hypothetical protein
MKMNGRIEEDNFKYLLICIFVLPLSSIIVYLNYYNQLYYIFGFLTVFFAVYTVLFTVIWVLLAEDFKFFFLNLSIMFIGIGLTYFFKELFWQSYLPVFFPEDKIVHAYYDEAVTFLGIGGLIFIACVLFIKQSRLETGSFPYKFNFISWKETDEEKIRANLYRVYWYFNYTFLPPWTSPDEVDRRMYYPNLFYEKGVYEAYKRSINEDFKKAVGKQLDPDRLRDLARYRLFIDFLQKTGSLELYTEAIKVFEEKLKNAKSEKKEK